MQASRVQSKMLSSCNLQLFAGNHLVCRRVRASQGCSRHLCQEQIHFHNQPRAEIPELLMDVDAFLQVNATDTSLTLSLLGETPLRCATPVTPHSLHKSQITRCF